MPEQCIRFFTISCYRVALHPFRFSTSNQQSYVDICQPRFLRCFQSLCRKNLLSFPHVFCWLLSFVFRYQLCFSTMSSIPFSCDYRFTCFLYCSGPVAIALVCCTLFRFWPVCSAFPFPVTVRVEVSLLVSEIKFRSLWSANGSWILLITLYHYSEISAHISLFFDCLITWQLNCPIINSYFNRSL